MRPRLQQASFHLTPEAACVIDAGLYPGAGQSSRLNGILERYALIMQAMVDDIDKAFEADRPILLSAYMSDGGPRPWLREWLSIKVEIAQGYDTPVEVVLERIPLLKRLAALSTYEITVLEESLAVEVAEMLAGEGGEEPEVSPTPEQVAALRLRARLTQAEAALLAGVGLRTWQKWEAGDQAIEPGAWKTLSRELPDPMYALHRDRWQQKPRAR